MDIIELEPFATGYMNAGRHDAGYRTACGFKAFAENIPLKIEPGEWFVGPVGSNEGLAFYYNRACGICAEEERYKEEKALHPELSAQLDKCMDYFFALDTRRIISKLRTAEQEKLERNKCAWAAGGGHSNPDYELLLRVGTSGIREKIEQFGKIHRGKETFYDSLLLCVEALEIIADRYKALAESMIDGAEEADKAVLRRLAAAF